MYQGHDIRKQGPWQTLPFLLSLSLYRKRNNQPVKMWYVQVCMFSHSVCELCNFT